MVTAAPSTFDAATQLAVELSRSDVGLGAIRFGGCVTQERVGAAVISSATAHDLDAGELWRHLAHHAGYRGAVIAAVAGPQEHLAWLTWNESARVRLAVAQNPAASEDQLRELGREPSYAMSLALAANPNCPASVLTAIVWHADHRNAELPRDAPDGPLRDAVAAHPNCPEELRAHIAAGTGLWTSTAPGPR